MNLTETEVFSIAFNRNVSNNLLKQSQIDSSYINWVYDWIDGDFLSLVKENEDGNYDEFIHNYIKPIWAWGVLYNNYNYIMLNITDKGVIQLLVEGTANIIGRDSRMDARFEIKENIYRLLRRLDIYCQEQKNLNNSLFSSYNGLKLTPSLFKYKKKETIVTNPY